MSMTQDTTHEHDGLTTQDDRPGYGREVIRQAAAAERAALGITGPATLADCERLAERFDARIYRRDDRDDASSISHAAGRGGRITLPADLEENTQRLMIAALVGQRLLIKAGHLRLPGESDRAYGRRLSERSLAAARIGERFAWAFLDDPQAHAASHLHTALRAVQESIERFPDHATYGAVVFAVRVLDVLNLQAVATLADVERVAALFPHLVLAPKPNPHSAGPAVFREGAEAFILYRPDAEIRRIAWGVGNALLCPPSPEINLVNRREAEAAYVATWQPVADAFADALTGGVDSAECRQLATERLAA